jgi:pimeloyl-ACP methyl ester carboxylesterase
MADKPTLVPHRQGQGVRAAIVFMHGFGGDAVQTWGNFPALLKNEDRLKNWDIYSLGYSTSLAFDIAGIWAADPEIITLGGLLDTQTQVAPLDGYQALALVAHSMGGLMLQRALLSSAALRARVSHVVLYGTPSGGLEKASPFHFWKRQIRDMAKDGEFVTTLRREWGATVGGSPAFRFVTVAGDRDEFVPRTSSLDPFPEACRRVVYGNHLEIVKPENADHLGYRLLCKVLNDEAVDAGPVDSAALAVESRDFQKAIDMLWPHRAELDDRGMVMLALALDAKGRRDDAIELLSTGKRTGTDPLGVLAGRLKRRWLAERRRADAEQALTLYRDALAQSETKNDVDQAYYHGINCAFMELAYGSDASAARELATKVLGYCARSKKDDVWRHATEGEAHLYLGDRDACLAAYRCAREKNPEPWQLASLYQQAVRAADLMGEDDLIAKLRALFSQPTP